jgi:hypothetical protein
MRRGGWIRPFGVPANTTRVRTGRRRMQQDLGDAKIFFLKNEEKRLAHVTGCTFCGSDESQSTFQRCVCCQYERPKVCASCLDSEQRCPWCQRFCFQHGLRVKHNYHIDPACSGCGKFVRFYSVYFADGQPTKLGGDPICAFDRWRNTHVDMLECLCFDCYGTKTSERNLPIMGVVGAKHFKYVSTSVPWVAKHRTNNYTSVKPQSMKRKARRKKHK